MTSFVNSKKFLSGCCLAAAIFLFAPQTAQADPLTLSGVVTMDKLSLTDATVMGHLISSEFDVMFSTNAGRWPGIGGCGPCPTGSHVDIAAFFPGEPSGSGSGTIQGVTYPAFALVSGGFLFEELFFSINERVDVVGREFEAMAVSDGVRGAGFHAITAKNAPRIIDVVHAGVALARGDPVRIRVFRGFDVNAIRGTSCRAKEAANTFFKAAFVAVQNVNPTVARLKMNRLVRIVLRDRLTKHVAEGHTEALDQRTKRLAHFSNDRCHELRV